MKILPVIILLFFTIISCSKDESAPVNNDDNSAEGFILFNIQSESWSADKVEVKNQSGSVYYIGTNNTASGFSVLTIRLININKTGSYGIGENEPGIIYGVKGSYVIKNSGSPDEEFTAYSKDISTLTIKAIDSENIDADFTMFLYNGQRTDSLLISGGRMKLEY